MANLLEEEKKGLEDKIKEIDENLSFKNKKDFWAKVLGGVSGGGILGLLELMIYNGDNEFLGHDFGHIGALGVSSIFGFSTYMMFHIDNFYDEVDSKSFLKLNFGKKEDENPGIDFNKKIMKYAKDPLKKQEAKINISVIENRFDDAFEEISEILEYTKDINEISKLFHRIFFPMAFKMDDMKNKKIEVSNCLEKAIASISHGLENYAEKYLKLALDSCEEDSEKIGLLCLQGLYFDGRNEKEKGFEYFREASMELIQNKDKFRFEEILGSKNKVYVHHSKFLGGNFVFKTGENKKELLREYEKTKIVKQVMENFDEEIHFVTPFALVENDEEKYFITRRAGNYNINELVKSQSDFKIKKLNDVIDMLSLFHLKMGDSSIKENFENETPYKNLNEKFIVRENIIGMGEDTYKNFCEGLKFICDELENSWKTVCHRDFHPKNVVLNKNLDLCVIDFEKSNVFVPYVDLTTFIENYSLNDFFCDNLDIKQNLIEKYLISLSDNVKNLSYEESFRNYHLASIFEHFHLFNIAGRYFKKNNKKLGKKFHKSNSLKHLNELNNFYTGQNLDKLKKLGEVTSFLE